jgi:hypothetical protein
MMSGATSRPVLGVVGGLLVGLVLAVAVGWTTLVLGGRTDVAGRTGLALGAAVLALVATGWGRGRSGWLRGLAAAAVVGGVMLAHFWTRLGRLP